MARHHNSFYDEVATFDHELEVVPDAGFDEVPTSLRFDRSERTMIELRDPAPTVPPEPPEQLEVEIVPPRQRWATPAAFAGGGSVASVPAPRDRYTIERVLGQGTFGRVFAARDTKLGRMVALKVLHAQHAASYEIRQRFVQEANAAACIAHPGIVTVFDAGELDDCGTAFIAMELLEGESLHARVARDGRLPSSKVRELARQIASTLGAAHRAGVIHRDLKPENIFVVPDPATADGERVKVLDFGLAKPHHQTASIKTHAATVFGTPAYMSPEQCESTRDIDHRSDIYALGCVLFQLVTGRPPFEGTMRELVLQHRAAEPPALRKLARDLDPALEALIYAMLAKDPAQRPQSMDDIVRALSLPPDTDAMSTREMVAMPRAPRARAFGLAVVAAVVAVAFCLSCGAV